MSFEDKRQKRQRPSREFSDIGVNIERTPPRQTRAAPERADRKPPSRISRGIDLEGVPTRTPHRPPDADFDFRSFGESSRPSRIIRLGDSSPAPRPEESVHSRQRNTRERSRAKKSQEKGSKEKKKPKQRKPQSQREQFRESSVSPPRARTQTRGKPKKRLKPQVKRALRNIISVFVLVSALLLFIFLVFKVDTIKVSGENPYTNEQVIEVSKLERGDNLIFLPAKSAKENIARRMPYIESVKIKRKLPGTVEIVVHPLTVEVSVAKGQQWIYTNREGKIAEIADLPKKQTLEIKGLPLKEPKAGGFLSVEEEEAETAYQEIMRSLQEEKVFSDCRSLDMSNLYDIRLDYASRIEIKLGSTADLAYKLHFAFNLIQNNIAEDEKGTLDVSLVKENSRGIFTPAVQGDGLTDNGNKAANVQTNSSNNSPQDTADSAGTSSQGENDYANPENDTSVQDGTVNTDDDSFDDEQNSENDELTDTDEGTVNQDSDDNVTGYNGV